MSKIVVVVSGSDQDTALGCVQRATGLGLADIKQRLSVGDPVAEYVLFRNDHIEVTDSMRTLLADLCAGGVQVRLFEIQPDDRFRAVPEVDTHEITARTLENILAEFVEEVGRQGAR